MPLKVGDCVRMNDYWRREPHVRKEDAELSLKRVGHITRRHTSTHFTVSWIDGHDCWPIVWRSYLERVPDEQVPYLLLSQD